LANDSHLGHGGDREKTDLGTSVTSNNDKQLIVIEPKRWGRH